MNTMISKKIFAFFATLLVLVSIYIIYLYGVLAFEPVTDNPNPMAQFTRGEILDRNGKPLAISTNFYHLSVTPFAVKKPRLMAQLFAPVLEMDEEEIFQKVTEATRVFYLKKRLDITSYDTLQNIIRENDLTGVRFDKIPGRIYPENDLAAQLIGFMGDSGDGLAGVEYSMQAELEPKYGATAETSRPGQNVYLTIDADLQYKLEKIAHKAMADTHAESMMLLAADAKTGEILSYVSLPSVNLNEYTDSSVEQRQDRPATYAYEPGSVFKIFSVASVYDAGLISHDEIFVCDGKYDVKTSNGERVTITCLDHHGAITAEQALQYSCNDALAQISAKVNSEYFLSKIRALGFGEKTGIELPSETAGLVRSTTDRLWSGRSKPTIAIGQEISVSALQMVQATTALTNGGVPVKLSVISRITDKDNNEVFTHIPEYKEPVFSPVTANYLLQCMKSTAQVGTGYRAALGDISVGVKTGTAQMIDSTTGGYSETDFLSNCVAVFPTENPEIILYIVITKAKGETYSGRIVAPVVRETADVIIDHMGMTREGAASLSHSGVIAVPGENLPEFTDVLPDYAGASKRTIVSLFQKTDWEISIVGNGYVVQQNPPAGTPITENMKIEFYLE